MGAGLFAADVCDPLAEFNQANDLYQKEQYRQAVDRYESVARLNMGNAELFYNLGNAYFRLHRPGLALLNYERALKLAPRDGDTRFNIKFVKTSLGMPEEPFSEQAVDFFNNIFSINELAALCSFLWILLCAGLTISLFRRNRKLVWANISLALVTVFFAAWFFVKLDLDVKTDWAVVVAGPAEARNGPGYDNSVGFTLPEGKKVMLLGVKDEWAAVGLRSEGLKGWIEKKYLEQI